MQSDVSGSPRDGLFPRLVARIVGWAASVFLRIERTGPALPPGPVLVVANHPNSLLDPLLIFRTGGRPARPLAKAPLFEQGFVGLFLKALGGLPVYRKQDHPDLMHLNDRTFDAAIGALHDGDAVQIYPEGVTHSEPHLAPLRTGAARIAFLSESRRGWRLGLQIAPVGLNYERKDLFRGRGLAVYGVPFTVVDLRDRYEADPQEAVRVLTSRIAAALEELTLNFTESEDRELVETAERMYAREKGWAKFRDRDDLESRFPRLKEFGRGLAWLRAHDPERHRDISYRVGRYRRRLMALGASEGDVPTKYRIRAVMKYLIMDGVPFTLGLPLALMGRIVWLPIFFLPALFVEAAKPHFEAVSTYKLSISLILTPIIYAAWVGGIWWLGSPRWALGAALTLPLLGLITVAWNDRWRHLLEDLRLFKRAVQRKGRQRVLAEWRRELVAEFDQIWEEMQAVHADGPAPRAQPSD